MGERFALTKVGKINDEAKVGAGDAPVRLLYVQPDGSLLSDPTEQVSMLPLTHNVDAFGYHSEVVDSEDAKSWAIFYDTDYKGKVGLSTIPQPVSWTWPRGAGRRARHLRRHRQHDPGGDRHHHGSAHRAEAGRQFRAFWNSFDESVNLMASGEVVVESMWSPAVTALRPATCRSSTPARKKAIAAGTAGS